MLKSTKDLILSVFRSYKKEYPLTEHILLNIETVERMLKIEPITEESRQVIRSKCDNCDIECPDNCEERTDRCPNCNNSLSNDLDWEFDYCPYCGQKLKY